MLSGHDEQHADQDHPRVPRRRPRRRPLRAVGRALGHPQRGQGQDHRRARRRSRTRRAPGLEYWTSEDGGYEGSLNPYVGDPDDGVEWLVHSWIGNRKASILDMNLQVWLGPHIDVPHLVHRVRHRPQRLPLQRRGAAPRPDGRRRLPQPLLRARERRSGSTLRGDDRFTLVGQPRHLHAGLQLADRQLLHGHLLATTRPSRCFGEAVRDRVDTWLGWVARGASRCRSRSAPRCASATTWSARYGYTLDPMNELSKKFLGAERVDELVVDPRRPRPDRGPGGAGPR